jgi:D-cysteine desulfhydrase
MSCKTANPYMEKILPLEPPRLQLAHLPTPVQRLERIEQSLGIELYVKRDDYTGAELSGNKIRKLEYALAEALEQGADTVITCGGVQSNHCRATAAAAARLGLNCLLLLRVPDPASPPALEANSLLDALLGAELVWLTPEQYQDRRQYFAREASRLESQGKKPYIIPEGASNAIGSWGYLRAMAELAPQLDELGINDSDTTLILATGSGGTAAGALMGKLLLDLPVRMATVNVCNDLEHFTGQIGSICADAVERFGLNLEVLVERDLDIIDGYVGRGYALSRPEELSCILELARAEGLILDPVYTGKAFYGLSQEVKRNPSRIGKRALFIHTGGLFGLFPKAAELSELI